MIDATQLPRVPSKLRTSNASHVADSSEGDLSHINQTNQSTIIDTEIQRYPAKELTLVDGRYRAIEQQK